MVPSSFGKTEVSVSKVVTILTKTRPKPEAVAPWSLISDSGIDVKAMRKAAADPNIMLISDWSQFKSWEYIGAEAASGFAIL